MKISSKVGVAVLAAGLIATSVGVYRGRPQPSSILDFTPIDADHVLVVRRDARAGSPSAYFELFEARDAHIGQKLVFRRGVTGAHVDPDPWLRKPNAVLAGGVYVARYAVSPLNPSESVAPKETQHLGGFRASDGALLWEKTSPMGAEKDPRGDGLRLLNLSFVAKDDKIVAFYGRELAEDPLLRAISIDPLTGAERWRVDLRSAGAAGPAWIRGGSLLVATGLSLVVIDLESGQTRATIAMDDPPCVGEGDVWFTKGGELQELQLANLTARIILQAPTADLKMTGACATRGGAVWILGSNRTTERAWIVGLDVKTSAERGRIELGPARIGAPDDLRTLAEGPEQYALSGESTRFVPMIASLAKAPLRLLMVDLDEKKVAWQTAPNERFTYASVRHVGDRQFLTESVSHLVATWDGATGHVLAAIRGGHGHGGPIFLGGRLWLRDEWNVASFHADTLASVWATGTVDVQDARSEADELFAHGRDADSGATP